MLQMLRVGPGELFPNVRLVDAQNNATDFHSYRSPDRRYLVNFWATYCVPCRKEMPELQKLAPELREAGVEVIGVSLDQGVQRDRIPAFLKRMQITYPTFTTDEKTFAQLFSGDEVFIPLSYVLDRSGRIVDIHSGWSPATARPGPGMCSEPGAIALQGAAVCGSSTTVLGSAIIFPTSCGSGSSRSARRDGC